MPLFFVVIFFPFLFPLSLLYRIGLWWDQSRKTRTQHRLPKPVISIGNLTWGGTGKTPFLFFLLSLLKNEGRRPAVLSRGYGGGQTGDEIQLLKEKFPDVPLGVRENRIQSAQQILEQQAVDVFILDDGFQHWSLARGLDIVCVDATRPWGNGFLIPLGSLRESKSALGRVNVVILTRTELVTSSETTALINEIKKENPTVPVFTAMSRTDIFDWNGKAVPPSSIPNKNALAVSAIGNPEAFEKILTQLGFNVNPLRFRDHHVYREPDLEKIERALRQKEAVIFTTEKDFVKLKKTLWANDSRRPVVYILRIKFEFSAQDEKSIREICGSFLASHPS